MKKLKHSVYCLLLAAYSGHELDKDSRKSLFKLGLILAPKDDQRRSWLSDRGREALEAGPATELDLSIDARRKRSVAAIQGWKSRTAAP